MGIEDGAYKYLSIQLDSTISVPRPMTGPPLTILLWGTGQEVGGYVTSRDYPSVLDHQFDQEHIITDGAL